MATDLLASFFSHVAALIKEVSAKHLAEEFSANSWQACQLQPHTPACSLHYMMANSVWDCQTVRLIEQIDFARSSGREQAWEQQFKLASR